MRTLLPLVALSFLATGCVSYGVGTTAATVPAGENTISFLIEGTPALDYVDGCEPARSEQCRADDLPMLPMVSTEARFGLSERSDWGLRVVGYSGAVFTYKRRLNADSTGLQMAVIGGGGLLNGMQTIAGETTLLVSGPEGGATPYGGLRMQATYPLSNLAYTDQPTVGAFFGTKFRVDEGLAISPEVGIHYDPSARELYDRTIVVVPVLTLHGRGVLGRLLGL